MFKDNWGSILRERVKIMDYMLSCGESLPLQRGNCVQGAHSSHDSENQACLTVYPEKGDYYCFHCDEGGSVVNYEINESGSSYRDACLTIADAYGIDLLAGGQSVSEEARAEWNQARERDKLVQSLLNASAAFWQDAMGDEQYAYWESRGISAESVKAFGIGYAGADTRALVEHLKAKFKECKPDFGLMKATGLFREDETSQRARELDAVLLRSLFEERHVLPSYRNRRGDVMHFIGRDATGESDKKYQNQYSNVQHGVNERVVVHGIWGLHRLRRPGKVLVTEGIVDGIAAQQALPEWTVISGGSVQWSKAKVSMLVEQLATLQGTKEDENVRCEVVVCFDREQGVPSESPGNRGAAKLCHMLEKAVRDYFAVPEGDKEAEKAAEESVSARMPIVRIARLPLPPEQKKVDICDFLQMESSARLSDWLGRGKTAWGFSAWLRGDSRRFVNTQDKSSSEKFVPSRASNEIRLAHYHAVLGGELCRYIDGVYRESESVLVSEIDTMLGDYVREGRVNEVISGIRRQETYEEVAETPYLINVGNGIVDASPQLKAPVLLPHTPYHRSTMQFNAKWVEGAYPEAFMQFLGEVLDASCKDLVLEMIGYCLLQTTELTKAFVLDGLGSNGKSTLISVIERLLGKSNYCAIPFQELEEDRFAPARLYGMAANLFSEMPTKRIYGSGKFKIVTAGETLTVQNKYEKSFKFRPTATQIVSVNKMPQSSDDSHGFYRRLRILPFKRRFEEGAEGTKNPKALLAELTTPAELEGILYLSVMSVREALRAGSFSNPTIVAERLSEYERENNNAKDFIEACVIEADSTEPKTHVYKAYHDYCQNILMVPDSHIMSAQAFYKKFKEELPDVKEGRSRQKTGTSERSFLGVRLVDSESDMVDEMDVNL